eukprot:3355-Heterococcus_DN1.PRE.2
MQKTRAMLQIVKEQKFVLSECTLHPGLGDRVDFAHLLVRAATCRAPTLHQKVYENRTLEGESVWNAEQVPPRANAEICMKAPLACICALSVARVDGFLPAAAKARSSGFLSSISAASSSQKLAQLAMPATSLRETKLARSRVLRVTVVDKELDEAFVESMNDVCTKPGCRQFRCRNDDATMSCITIQVIRAYSANDEAQASLVKLELQELVEYLTAEYDMGTVHFLEQVLCMLDHKVPQGAVELRGPYKKAFNRLVAALTGTVWRIGAPEDINSGSNNNQQQQQQQQQEAKQRSSEQQQGSADSSSGSSVSSAAEPKEGINSKDGYYVRLGLNTDATAADIKASYRKLAMQLDAGESLKSRSLNSSYAIYKIAVFVLKPLSHLMTRVHPDVSDAEDAHEVFIELSMIYNLLLQHRVHCVRHTATVHVLESSEAVALDPDARVRYDTFGPAGLNDYKSSSNSDEMWEDLAQWVRDNKKAKKPGKRDQARAKVGPVLRAVSKIALSTGKQ